MGESERSWGAGVALFALALAGCAQSAAQGADANVGDGPAATSRDAGLDLYAADLDALADLGHARLDAQTLSFTLDAGAFAPTAAHPSALVYVPSGFDPTPPLHVVVYLHGFDNCVVNIVRDAAGRCTDGGVVHPAYALASQLEQSKKNAILLAPETEFEQSSGNAGHLADPESFRQLLAEVLVHLAPLVGARTLADVAPLIVSSHSGGYTAADDIVKSRGVTTDEIWMLDSLYSASTTADVESWIESELASFEPPPIRRFATFYTVLSGCQGTDCNSEKLAADIAGRFPRDAGVVVDEPSAAVTWTDDIYRHGVLCKHSSLTHDEIPRYYFGRLLATSGLPDR